MEENGPQSRYTTLQAELVLSQSAMVRLAQWVIIIYLLGGYEAPAPKVGIFAAPEAPPPTGSGKFGGAPAAGEGTGVPTSVKVHNPPGGKSQITFG